MLAGRAAVAVGGRFIGMVANGMLSLVQFDYHKTLLYPVVSTFRGVGEGVLS